MAKCLYSYRDDLPKRLFKITAQVCKSPLPVDVPHTKTLLLKLPSNVCKGALKSLFWAPNRLSELPEFPFNLIDKCQ